MDLRRLIQAHRLFLRRILEQQVQTSPINRLALAKLTRSEHAELREALSAASNLDQLVRDILF